MNLIISVSIIKEVSIITSLYGFMYMYTLSVPLIIPTVPAVPVINVQQQVSINISINVSTIKH